MKDSQSPPRMPSNGQSNAEPSAAGATGTTRQEAQVAWTAPVGLASYEDALALVRAFQKPSTSFIQRKLQLGYNRAASFIERMEAENICTGRDHAGVRHMVRWPTPPVEAASPAHAELSPGNSSDLRGEEG